MIVDIEKKLLNKEKITNDETILFLNHIIKSINEIVNDDTFINKCDLVQGLIGRYLNKLNIINHPCITNKCIMKNVVGHSFIIAKINNNNYIIDPTFIQFACIDFDELYINNLRIKSKSPFYYAVNINRDFTKRLLTYGYIELTNETAYWYGNSFYNTLTNITNDYKFSNIPGELLINSFLNGNEKLQKYEYPEINLNYLKQNMR